MVRSRRSEEKRTFIHKFYKILKPLEAQRKNNDSDFNLKKPLISFDWFCLGWKNLCQKGKNCLFWSSEIVSTLEVESYLFLNQSYFIRLNYFVFLQEGILWSLSFRFKNAFSLVPYKWWVFLPRDEEKKVFILINWEINQKRSKNILPGSDVYIGRENRNLMYLIRGQWAIKLVVLSSYLFFLIGNKGKVRRG